MGWARVAPVGLSPLNQGLAGSLYPRVRKTERRKRAPGADGADPPRRLCLVRKDRTTQTCEEQMTQHRAAATESECARPRAQQSTSGRLLPKGWTALLVESRCARGRAHSDAVGKNLRDRCRV